MHESDLKHVLCAYAATETAPDQLCDIRRELKRRTVRRRWIRSVVAAFVLCFAFLTLVPVGGNALAVVRREIQPTLFLKTTLGEARKVAREPLQLPATYPTNDGDQPLTDSLPALVGRWLSHETVAVTVTGEEDGMGTIYFDLRRSTYRAEPGSEEMGLKPTYATERKVKVGRFDGLVFLDDQGHDAWEVRWKTDTHNYRLVVGRPMSIAELTAYAAQIH
ncbi:MAG TPA: hypothetical protein VD969_26615 [Symbiobacteriaceae bacterium]|nr:hypothetical protein [Symbiobacteriaceae bacterium]